jgi:hypothetical protein
VSVSVTTTLEEKSEEQQYWFDHDRHRLFTNYVLSRAEFKMSKNTSNRPLGIILVAGVYWLLSAILVFITLLTIASILTTSNNSLQAWQPWAVLGILSLLAWVLYAHGVGIWTFDLRYWKSSIVIHALSIIGTILSMPRSGLSFVLVATPVLNAVLIMYLLHPKVQKLFVK